MLVKQFDDGVADPGRAITQQQEERRANLRITVPFLSQEARDLDTMILAEQREIGEKLARIAAPQILDEEIGDAFALKRRCEPFPDDGSTRWRMRGQVGQERFDLLEDRQCRVNHPVVRYCFQPLACPRQHAHVCITQRSH